MGLISHLGQVFHVDVEVAAVRGAVPQRGRRLFMPPDLHHALRPDYPSEQTLSEKAQIDEDEYSETISGCVIGPLGFSPCTRDHQGQPANRQQQKPCIAEDMFKPVHAIPHNQVSLLSDFYVIEVAATLQQL